MDARLSVGIAGAPPLVSGQPRTWACGIIHVLGQLNFLPDKAIQPYMTMAQVCAGFGVGQSTRLPRPASSLMRCTRTGWTPPGCYGTWSIKIRWFWMAEVNSLLVDLRDMPREVQEIAFAKGIIPYLPADQD